MAEDKDTKNQRPKIVITSADIQKRKNDEVSLNNINQTHPFDRQDFKKFLDRGFPQYGEKIDHALRPKISNHPDDLEEWEQARILRRKDRISAVIYNESDLAYLSRFLYEETFSVNQDPGNNSSTKKGSHGLTPGGLISHFYNNGVKEAYKLNPQGKTVREAVIELKKRDGIQLRDLSLFISAISARRISGRQSDLFIKNTDTFPYPEEYDSVEFRLIKLLQARPDFFDEIRDNELKRRLGMPIERSLNKLQLLQAAWHRFQTLITEKGTFASDRGDNLKKDLDDFLYFRTHPETQIFYEFLSPSGYLNDKDK